MDPLLFGDNQFFGINHMSEQKAREQSMRFQNIAAVIDVLQTAYGEGIRTFMCTTHDRVEEICNYIRINQASYPDLTFYPGMPYAHKYANAVTELGVLGAVKRFLPSDGLLDAVTRGGVSFARRDIEGLTTLLIDAEMKMFQGLRTPVVFLQNVVTDLLLGLGFDDAFGVFAQHVRSRYRAEPGFITMNLPMLLATLQRAGISNPIVCTNFNKIGFRMSGGVHAYNEALSRFPCRVIAMSVFASGAIPPSEAIEWIAQQEHVKSIVFGASTKSNISHTARLVRQYYGCVARSPLFTLPPKQGREISSDQGAAG